MKQLSLFKEKNYQEFGGELLKNKRRSRRPLSSQRPLHLIFKSQIVMAVGGFRYHEDLIKKLLFKYASQFDITVYEIAVCSNHIHLAAKVRQTPNLHHFLRCFSGQVAFALQKLHPEIFKDNPFWLGRPYTKVLIWGQQWDRVLNYIEKNRLETRGWIEYKR